LAIAAPVAPVVAIAGTNMNSPGKTIRDFTNWMDSVEPNNSTTNVEVKKVATHRVAMIAAVR
jgi:hypothetical protein